MTETSLRLPKDLLADPRHQEVEKALTTNTRPLWENGTIAVPSFALSLSLARELKRVIGMGMAAQGIEQISKALAREQHGLDALAEKAPSSPQLPRISRVLIVANDGSERFYRDCDAALSRYRQRTLGLRLDVTGEELGQAVLGAPKLVRALLITDKKAAARVLLALLPG